MKIENLNVKLTGPQTGLSVFNDDNYLGTYQSFHELILDLVYRFDLEDFDGMRKKFHLAPNKYTIVPYKYRGVCSELYWPTEFNYSYIYYCDTLSGLFDKFEIHEKRALNYEKYYYYGSQGNGIHIFNNQSMKYEFWIGGNHIHTVSDVMNEVKSKGLSIPSGLQLEYDELGIYDVFISHKSDDFKLGKIVYDFLTQENYKVFLSEISLPTIANADYIEEINKALNHSKHLVVIADSLDKISSGWVKYEWTSFLNEKLSGRKEGNLMTIKTNNMDLADIPFPLRQFEVIGFNDIIRLRNWLPVNR